MHDVPRLLVSLEQTPPFDENVYNNRPPPQPSHHLLFPLSAQPPCQVEVESDPAKRTSDDSGSEN